MNRFYEDESVYAKVSLDLARSTTLTFTSGYSEPELSFGDWTSWGVRYENINRNFWATATLDAKITDNVSFTVSGFQKEQKFIYPLYLLPDEMLWSKDWYEICVTGMNARLGASMGRHMVVMGAEIDRTKAKFSMRDNGYDETWGVYINDTITLGPLSVVPGIRYDHLALTNNMISPSIGITWHPANHTMVRASAARGFRRPYISHINYDYIQDLEPETVASYQAGIENTALPFCRVKATLFEHNLKDTWDWDSNWVLDNAGKTKRYGYELEMETIPFYHLSAKADFTYVYTDYYGTQDNDDMYSARLTILYDNPDIITAELFGQYLWWNKDRIYPLDYRCDTMIWDLNISKQFKLSEHTSMDLFFTAHNIFDGRQYWDPMYENAHRWVEAGLRFHF